MGIENLKLWRTEPFLSTFQDFSADKPGLEWKYPLQGRWFSTSPYYSWLGPDTIMKELDTRFPFNFYDKTGRIDIPGEGFTMKGVKSAADLAKDQALLKEWFPKAGFGEWSKKIVEDFPPGKNKEFHDWVKAKHQRDLSKGILPGQSGRYTDNPVVTYPRQLEYSTKRKASMAPMTAWESKIIGTGGPSNFHGVMTPPLDIANQAKVNLWESFRQNFMKPNASFGGESIKAKGIHYPKSGLENIMRIPHKAADIWGRYRAGHPIKSGIPWNTVGKSILNNPLTRFAGSVGNVALAGSALSDVYTGSTHTRDWMDQTNRWGGLRKNVDTGRLEQNPFHGARIGAQDAQARRGVSTGGIVSLML